MLTFQITIVREHSPISILASNDLDEGRIILFTVEINEITIQIIDIYAPNNPSERIYFINNIQNIIDINCINIVAGDFD